MIVRRFFRALMILVAALTARPSQATWTQISQLSKGCGNCLTMVSRTRWFLGAGDPNGNSNCSPAIYTSSDEGVTWQPTACPQGLPVGAVTDIFFDDTLHGYAMVFCTPRSSVVAPGWETTDGGATWFANDQLPEHGSCTFRTQLGLTFLSWRIGGQYARIDSVTGVYAGNEVNGAMRTTDGGATWWSAFSVPPDLNLEESWGLYYCAAFDCLFSAPEVEGDDPRPLISDTRGVTFRWSGSWPEDDQGKWRPTGGVAGGGNAVYVQSVCVHVDVNGGLAYYPKPRGLCRTTDCGATWVNVGGPSNFLDSRFAVFGCHGESVIACDHNGGIWRTDDGGDGTLTAGGLCTAVPSSLALGEITTCAGPQSIAVSLANFGCDTVTLDSVTLPANPNVSWITRPPSGVLPPDAEAHGALRVSADVPGVFSDPIVWSITRRNLTHDVVRTALSMTVRAVERVSLDRATVACAPETMCGAGDTSRIVLHNLGCDTVVIEGCALSPEPVFSMARAPAGAPLIGGDSASITVAFTPRRSGMHTGTVVWSVQHGSGRRDTLRAVITASVTDSIRVLSAVTPRDAFFGAINQCAMADTIIRVFNHGCAPLVITAITAPRAPFALAPISFPQIVAPGDSLRFHIVCRPDTPGRVDDTMHIQSNDSLEPDRAIALHARITGPVALGIALDALPTPLHPGDVAPLAVRLTGAMPAEITAVRFAVAFDMNAFVADSISVFQGVVDHIEHSPGAERVVMRYAGGIDVSRALFAVQLRTLMGTGLHNPITVTEDSIASGGSLPAPCLATFAADTIVAEIKFCADSTARSVRIVPSMVMRMFPNPANDQLTIIAGTDPIRCAITDLVGRLRIAAACGAGRAANFNITALNPGIYTVCTSDGQRATLSIIR